MKRIVILGGTFNPIHNGHLELGRRAMVELGYQQVVFIPSHNPAHKEVDGSISPKDRLRMVQLAIEDEPAFRVDDCELIRDGISYSIDTVGCVYGGYEIEGNAGLIIGDDLLESFHLWKDANELVKQVDLVVAHRKYKEELATPYKHTYLNNPIWPISSSQIRDAIRQGQDISSYVPPKVAQFIFNKGFYL